MNFYNPYYFIITRATPLLILFFFSAMVSAEIFFEADFEDGVIPVTGHPGGGTITWLGGSVNADPGDGTGNVSCGSPPCYRNVIAVNELDARDSVTGSNWALKTHYAANYTASFQKNTTIIRFPETEVVYVRWHQKWSRSWIWPGDQHKLCKIKTDLSNDHSQYWTQNFKQSFGNDYINLTKLEPRSGLFERYIFSSYDRTPSDFREEDSIENGLGPSGEDVNYVMEVDRWYAIEVMVRANTPGLEDGEYNMWIDDQLVLSLTNANTRGTRTSGLGIVELQHIAQFAGGGVSGTVDMPTYMDNIVIADERIGAECPLCPSPPTDIVLE